MRAFFLRIGVVIILLGIGAGMYTSQQTYVSGFSLPIASKPYQNAQVPLIVSGALVMFAALIFPHKKN